MTNTSTEEARLLEYLEWQKKVNMNLKMLWAMALASAIALGFDVKP